jgi:hypothetical protein
MTEEVIMSDDVFKRFAPNLEPSEAGHRAGQSAIVQPLRPQSTSAPEFETDKMVYTAVGLNKRVKPQRRLMLYFHDGTVAIMSYAYLMEIISTSHQFVSLIYTNCVITLKGYNLDGLLDLLQEERVKALQCYSPKIHLKPTDRKQVIILEMKRESLQDILGNDKEQE